jgi:hypothetical protein
MVGIDGTLLGACVMVDVSAAGAQLIVQSSTELPDQFSLVLSRGGQLQRYCSVAWRSPSAIGVQFLPSPSATGKRNSSLT